MAELLTDLLASVRTRLQDELEAQLRAVSDKHAEAVAVARRDAELEAEQRWSALLQEARSETQQQVEAAVTAARQEQEATTTIQPSVTHESFAPVLQGFHRIGTSSSLTGALNALAQCATEIGEATLFVLTGAELQPWPQAAGPAHAADELTRDALASKAQVRSETAIAIPLLLGESVVAVLYGKCDADAPSSTLDRFEALARYGAAHLANVTLLRTAQAQRWLADTTRLYGEGSTTDTPGDASEDETAAARRFARLLVSEIKLYNEGAVRVGRERRDLLQRLGEEIDRARRLYEERVPATIPGRAQYFHDELVQTLAGGDSTLLG